MNYRPPKLGQGDSGMDSLIWIGALISCLGLVGLGVSIVRVLRARRAGLDD